MSIADEIDMAYKCHLRIHGEPIRTTITETHDETWRLYSEDCGPEGHWDVDARADKPETAAKIVAFLQRAIETGVLKL